MIILNINVLFFTVLFVLTILVDTVGGRAKLDEFDGNAKSPRLENNNIVTKKGNIRSIKLVIFLKIFIYS